MCRSGIVRAVPVARRHVYNVSRQLEPEAVAQLVADYQAGTPTTELIKQHAIGKGTVLGILDKAGVIRKQRRMSAEQVAEAVGLYRQGWSFVRLGRGACAGLSWWSGCCRAVMVLLITGWE